MSGLWLTPIRTDDQEQIVTLLQERLELQPADAVERFLALVKAVHPRLLLTFKANLLLSEESELACGVDELPFELASQESIRFGQGPLGLSHCAQAYLDRLPTGKEAGEWLQAAAAKAADMGAEESVRQWIELMLSWHRQGYAIALLKEENG